MCETRCIVLYFYVSRKMRDCLVMSKLQELFNLPSLLLDIQDIQDTDELTSHTSASSESGWAR